MVNFFCYSATHHQFYNMWFIDGNASFLCYVSCFWNFVNDNWTEFSNSKVESDAGRSREKKVLDWPTRYRIAAGAARGISYLHHDCIPHIIHRDIKSSNILLDQNMDARVSDFGLATLMQPNKTHVSTIVAGTFGYLAPGIDTTWLNTQFLHFTLLFASNWWPGLHAEYFDTGRATLQGDVYSFGVVLLELLTGKKPSDEAFMEEGTMLVTWVRQEFLQIYFYDYIHKTSLKSIWE